MSPILVRPVREQLEHDRVIRLLQAKYKRKFDVGINPGQERLVAAGSGQSAQYPDLVLHSSQRSRRLVGVVEVETAESVNHLEAMSQWAAFARLRVPFHLYVPTASVDPARRLCADFRIPVAELWVYHWLGDQMRFTLMQRSQTSRVRPAAGRNTAGAKAAKGTKATKLAGSVKTTKKAAKTSGRAVKKTTRIRSR